MLTEICPNCKRFTNECTCRKDPRYIGPADDVEFESGDSGNLDEFIEAVPPEEIEGIPDSPEPNPIFETVTNQKLNLLIATVEELAANMRLLRDYMHDVINDHHLRDGRWIREYQRNDPGEHGRKIG